MMKVLALMGAAALLAACAQAPEIAAKAEQGEKAEEAAVVAASLGYHGPGRRPAVPKRD